MNAASGDFRSLKGARDPDGGGEAFYARQGLTGFRDCTIWIYHDRSIEPSASCDATTSDMDELRRSVQSCLGSGWSSTSSGGDYDFQGPGSIRIRLHRDSKGTPGIWVDAPSRD